MTLQRRAPLTRKTPLRARKPIDRGGPIVRRKQLVSRTPISAVSVKRAAENRKRTVVVSGMRLAMGNRCARCRSSWKVAGHERLARAHGGDILAPDALLCNVCNGWCEDNPVEAAWDGWKVSGKHPHDPALAIGQARDINGYIVDLTIPIDPLEEIA